MLSSENKLPSIDPQQSTNPNWAETSLSAKDALTAALGFRPTFDIINPLRSQESLEAKETADKIKYFGALPHYSRLEEHLRGVAQDLERLQDSYGISNESAIENERRSLLTYRLKYGSSLLDLVEKCMAKYPAIENQTGKIYSVFGLSGSGKSLMAEALREKYGDRLIVMDSDTCRYNLFAPLAWKD